MKTTTSLRVGLRVKLGGSCAGVLTALATGALSSPSALACAACFGRSDSPLAAGMNMGILSLLVVIVALLGVIAGFFVFLARRSAMLAKVAESMADPVAALPEPGSSAVLPVLPRLTRDPGHSRLHPSVPAVLQNNSCRKKTGRTA